MDTVSNVNTSRHRIRNTIAGIAGSVFLAS